MFTLYKNMSVGSLLFRFWAVLGCTGIGIDIDPSSTQFQVRLLFISPARTLNFNPIPGDCRVGFIVGGPRLICLSGLLILLYELNSIKFCCVFFTLHMLLACLV